MCEHKNFSVAATVNRLEDTRQFIMDVTVNCIDCGLPFQFMGLEPGLDLQGAKVDLDGTTARLAIHPQGARPSPLQRMAFGVSRSH